MSAAAGDKEYETPVDNGKEERSGSACSGEDTRHVSSNIRITVIWWMPAIAFLSAVVLVIIKFGSTVHNKKYC